MDYSLILGIHSPDENGDIVHRLGSAWTNDPEWLATVDRNPPHRAGSLREKLKGVKSAVHKLLSPFPPRRTGMGEGTQERQSSSLPSRLPSIIEGATESDNINDRAERTAEFTDGISPVSPLTPSPRLSVFTAYRGGVAGWKTDIPDTPVIYYLGIIDILQQYTIKKKAAHCIKRFSIGCCHEIDTVAPKRYRDRFQKYMISKIKDVQFERAVVEDRQLLAANT
jgi:hypothetical protein